MSRVRWLKRPLGPTDYIRIAHRLCPPFIQRAYKPWTPLFELQDRLEFVWRGRWLVRLNPGCICDLASVPWWIPPFLVSRNSRCNWQDDGACVHDMLHLGVARFPLKARRAVQARMADALMLDLWLAAAPTGWRPRKKWFGVRLAAPFLFRPDEANVRPDWMTITDLETEKQVETEPPTGGAS